MPLIRGHHSFDHSFTQIPNAWVRDTRLSFKARGLLAMLLSHSQGWELSIQSLVAQNIEGKDALRAAVHELETFGYLVRKQVTENGRFGESIWETKDPEPLAGFPPSVFPPADNPQLKKTNNKKTKNKNTNTSELFDEFWKEYPRKRDKGAAFKAFRSALNRAKFEDILAGVIRYTQDPDRKPEFTKYPATWLNADSWENDYGSAPDSARNERREKLLRESKEFLEEQQRLAEQASPAPKCEHGLNVALCQRCMNA